MRFTVSNTELNRGVQAVARAISPRNTVSVLTGIYLEAKDDCLLLRGTDLEIGIECNIKANIEEKGTTVIPAKHFSELVRKLPDTDISFTKEKDKNNIIIKYLNSELSFNTYDAEQYSFLPEIDNYCNFKINPVIFSEMIKQVSIAISHDDSRPAFTGVLFETPGDNKLRFVSTDTHRLTLRDNPLPGIDIIKPVIVPGKALQEVNKIIDKETEEITIGIGENQAIFQTEDIKVKVRLIDGQFPVYQDVIPRDFSTLIKVHSADLIKSLERAILMSYDETKSSSNVIKLQLEGNTLVISSQSSDLGYVHEEINVYSEGEKIEIAFNGRYLLDILKVIGDENVKIKLNGSLSPAIFEGDTDSNYLCLILPLRA
ncbi:MAG: polymerase subunit beta [Clostridia bacterium]|jgi:DNA polymerase-3 subunit beta|nr:polymerase beta subunit [Clostridiales bacterium]MDK2984369.1 polymerase subunit beta [Clostridia bacterium]